MSYQRKTTAAHQALGVDVVGVATLATEVVKDPFFPEATCRVRQLIDIENRQTPKTCTKIVSNSSAGIGLRKVMPALRTYVYAQQHPWVYPVAAVGVIGLPFLLGYLAGKGGR